MKTIIITLLLSTLISTASAEEILCPVRVNVPWDKMEESEFSKKNVKLQLDKLQKYFDGEIVVAEEFVSQSLLIIEGGALRQSIEYWKSQKNQKNTEFWSQKFCEFMKTKAYFVH